MSDRIKVSINKSDKKEIKRKMKVAETKAVILHPSLGCPLILLKGQPITIFILATDEFSWTTGVNVKSENTKDLSGWDSNFNARIAIARYLKISIFNDALNSKNNKTKTDKPIFTREEAIKNIAVRSIGMAVDNNLTNKTNSGSVNPKKENFEAILRNDARELYAKEGLKYLFQIDIHNFDFSQLEEEQSDGNKNSDNDLDDDSDDNKSSTTKDSKSNKDGLNGDDSDGSPDDIINSMFEISWITSDSGNLLERQDHYTNTFIKNKKYIKGTELEYAFKIDELGEFKFEVDKNQPIQNYHPIYLRKSNSPLNIGQVTDVHVSSRQHAFTKSKAELIYGSNTNIIGPMVNTSYAALKDLMDQFGNDDKIDLLLFTGDLIDYVRNYHPKKFMKGELKTTGDIWKEMYFDNLNQLDKGKPKKDKKGNILPNNDDYPSSIDNVTIYSLILYYYKKYKKPIFMISGNHEMYSVPYGISPRATRWRAFGKATGTWSDQSLEKQIRKSSEIRKMDMKKEKGNGSTVSGLRANEGIPADHNLTFGEATLMYGPSYHQIISFGSTDFSNTLNFKAKNIDWFYIVFTPLSDYTFTWGKQNFIFLEWGDGETMIVTIDHQKKLGGILPRASKSLTTKQVKLVKDAVKLKKPCTILVTHFTFANYKQSVPSTDPGKIAIHDLGTSFIKRKPLHHDHDWGTFELNREFVYRMIANNEIHFTLSGHSHRSALYQHIKFTSSIKGLKIDKFPAIEVDCRVTNPKTKEFEGFDANKAKIIVTASGGPIPIRNTDNGLANWGLDTPSGSYVYFKNSGKEEKIGIKTTRVNKVPAAQPRLATALDIGDLLGYDEDDIGGFIQVFQSTEKYGDITLTINPKFNLPSIKWIGEITFYMYIHSKKPTKYTTTLRYYRPGTYKISVDDPKMYKYMAFDYLKFVSIKANSKLSNDPAYSQYNLESPWQFRIEGITRKKFMKRFKWWKRWLNNAYVPITAWTQKYISGGWYRNSDISHSTIIRVLSKENGGLGPNGYFFDRHPKFGETAQHQLYSTYFNDKNEFASSSTKKPRKKLNKK